MATELDRWLSPQIRARFERLYYAEVNSLAHLDRLSRDPAFLENVRDGEAHVGLFADHGVVHVRDVAHQVLNVLDRAHGRLIPSRPSWRFSLMEGYGVLLAYFHDIGMFDASAFGRAMHPEFALHSVFNPDLDEIIDAIWQENSANLAWHLTRLADRGALEQPPQVVLRELLALCMCHSKSKVPIEVLNAPTQLREVLIEAATMDLRHLYGVQRLKRARQKLIQARLQEDAAQAAKWETVLRAAEDALAANKAHESLLNPDLHRHYRQIPGDTFCWLISDHPATRELVADVVDTVRALRCADAMRQRGAVLKTSGGYEIFVSRQTARAIFSLQLGDSSLYLLELPDPISAGEANIASSELDASANLRISFHRGVFATADATAQAIESGALVVDDIVQDTIGSFRRPPDEPHSPGLKTADEMQLLLEEVDDSIEFVAQVRARMEQLNPWLAGRIRLAPSLRDTSELERARYLTAAPLNWDLATRLDLLGRIKRSGHRVDGIDPEKAFEDVRMVDLHTGEVLLEAGAPAAFVYIPMGPGLSIFPLGGYDAMPAKPWTLMGVTGVIRGAARNATVVAESALRLLMIPKGVYLRDWHRTHSPESFIEILEETTGSTTDPESLSPLERSVLLGRVSFFEAVEHEGLLALGAQTLELTLPAGSVIFEKGAPGDSLYIVISGAIQISDGEQVLETLGPNQAFGEMAVLAPEPRMATAAAETETRLLQLPAPVLDRFLIDHPEVARAVITVLTRRLRERAGELVALRLRLPQGPPPH